MERTSAPPNYPVTPDARYFIVRGKLWRMPNPNLDPVLKADLVKRLMSARRAVRSAKLESDLKAEMSAHREVDDVKRNLGQRGPVWRSDGSPDFNRHPVKTKLYVAWYASMKKHAKDGCRSWYGIEEPRRICMSDRQEELSLLRSAIRTRPCWLVNVSVLSEL